MITLAESAPLLAAFAFIGVLMQLMALSGRVSRGSRSSGPVLPEESEVHGQRAQAWGLARVQADLETSPDRVMTNLRNLCERNGIDVSDVRGYGLNQCAVLTERLEAHLGIQHDTTIR